MCRSQSPKSLHCWKLLHILCIPWLPLSAVPAQSGADASTCAHPAGLCHELPAGHHRRQPSCVRGGHHCCNGEASALAAGAVVAAVSYGTGARVSLAWAHDSTMSVKVMSVKEAARFVSWREQAVTLLCRPKSTSGDQNLSQELRRGCVCQHVPSCACCAFKS